jgi:hypothetical protein
MHDHPGVEKLQTQTLADEKKRGPGLLGSRVAQAHARAPSF